MTNFRALLLVGSVVVAGTAAGVALAAGTGAVAKAPTEFVASPVFPTAKAEKVNVVMAVPSGAQYRVRSGKSGFKYVACDRQRSFAGGTVELGCLSFSKAKGWGKSIRWFGKYELFGLTGELPAAPVESASN